MRVTDVQVRKLMEEHTKHGRVGPGVAAGRDAPKHGAKYLRAGKVPSELRTAADVADADRTRSRRTGRRSRSGWSEAPELEAKALFEDLCERYPERYQEGQLRTLQRRVKQWRALEGPPKEVFFAQEHRPGEAMQTDFTSVNELGITIGGEAFPHLLCHQVLPYSNWEWATVAGRSRCRRCGAGCRRRCFSWAECRSITRRTTRRRRPTAWMQASGSSTPSTLALMRHLGMKPRTTAIGEKEQNGDVEAMHGALKRRLEQHLLLRGSRDFESVEACERWLQAIAGRPTVLRSERLSEELAVMRVLDVHRLPEYREEEVRVKQGSTIRVKNNTYSVPSRLKGERVRVRVYDDRSRGLLRRRPPADGRAASGRGRAQHQLPAHHLVAGEKARGVRALPVPRGAVSRRRSFRQAYDVLA